MQGKVRRLQLGPKEKLSLLKLAYEDWREGKLPDRAKLIRHVDNRAARFTAEYVDNDFKVELLEYITQQEARFTKVNRQRLTLAGMLPVYPEGDAYGDANAHIPE